MGRVLGWTEAEWLGQPTRVAFTPEDAAAGVPEGHAGHDGYDLIRWIRDLETREGRHTPAAAFTAYAHSDDARRVLAAGFQQHRVKPQEPDDLIAAVAALVRSRDSSDGRRDDNGVMKPGTT